MSVIPFSGSIRNFAFLERLFCPQTYMLAPWVAVRSPWRLYRAFHYHRIALLSTVKTFSPTSRRQQYFSATHKAGITDGAESLSSDELDRSKESINQISNLITQGEYQLANRLRLKLSQQGIRLPTNPIYAQAVRLALLQPNYVEDCPSFIAWLRACPDASHSGHKPFLDIRHILFSRPTENVHLIHQFGLVCASKGYIQLVNEDILPVIARLPESMNREGMCNEIAEEVRKYGVGSHHNSMTSTPRAGPMSSKSRHVPSGTGTLVLIPHYGIPIILTNTCRPRGRLIIFSHRGRSPIHPPRTSIPRSRRRLCLRR